MWVYSPPINTVLGELIEITMRDYSTMGITHG